MPKPEPDSARTLREAVRKLRAKERTMPEAGRLEYGPGILAAALVLEEQITDAIDRRTVSAPETEHKASDGSDHDGPWLQCTLCQPLSNRVIVPEVLDSLDMLAVARARQAEGQVSGRKSIRDPEPSVSHWPEQEVAYVVQDSVVMRDAQPMSHAVADLILRQSMALLDEGIGPKSYGSVMGPDAGAQDVALILQAVDVIGQENILDRDLQDEIQSLRGEHG